MKALSLLLTALACGFAGYASAADLSPYKAVPAPLAAPASWAGFYFGVDAGLTFDAPIKFTTDLSDVTRINPRGATFGGHAGHNWQTGPFVYGVELFAAWNGNSSTVDLDKVTTLNARVDYFGSARAKLGLTIFNDALLLYGTGGIGLAHSTARVTEPGLAPALALLAPAPAPIVSNAFSVAYGPVVGAGVEWRIFGSPNWLLRADWQHYMLGHNTFSFSGGVQANVASSQTIDVVMGGLSYKF